MSKTIEITFRSADGRWCQLTVRQNIGALRIGDVIRFTSGKESWIGEVTSIRTLDEVTPQ